MTKTPPLKQALAQQHAPEPEHKSIAHLLVDPKIKQQIAAALPRHMTPDRLARIVLTEVRKVPKLMQCDQMSFMGAVMQAAQLGLEPGAALGHCYLIPFDKKAKVGNQWQVVATDVQLIIGYRGMLDLARRSGQILSMEARVIYEHDHYELDFGLESRLVHRPNWDAADRGPAKFVYAVAKLKDGGTQFEVMSVAEINAIRDASQGYKAALSNAERYNKSPDTPWVTHYDEMAKKTVLRRLFKYLPVSIEMQTAVGLDEHADAGINQHNALMIDADYRVNQPAKLGNDHSTEMEADLNQVIHDAMVAADSADALNNAWELGGPDWNPSDELRSLYNKRAEELKV